ncbi:U-box domain-containing protein 4 [Apostasia shenzhenica]|uniref:U-box domain-containing protein 4 n=1 Tax=Apostasia shenzhenica TaxID=1088818 RepID=A0A2I0ARM5_9ASPA|nr:U-box domain-containing protein 4 [Apostasia shenzhenica]
MDRLNRTEGNGETEWEENVRLFTVIVACDGEDRRLRAIIEFARLSKLAPDSALFGVVPVLVDLFRCSPPAIRDAAAFALCRLSRRPAAAQFCPVISQSGAIPLILGFLPESSNGFRRSLLRLLRALVAFDSPSRAILARNNGLEIVLNIINACSDDTRKYLLEILAAMAMLREVRRVIISMGALPFLIEAVSFGRMVSRSQAATAIGLLGIARRVRHMLVESGSIPALVKLLREGEESARLIAGNALGIISSHVDCLHPVAEAGAISLYMELLQGPEPLGREIAEDVFCVLAVEEVNAVEIYENLVRILHGDNEAARSAAVDVLWDLAGYKHSVSVIRDSGAIPLLIDILREGNSDLREKAMGTVVQLSYDGMNRRALAESGGIPLLIGLLKGDSEEVKDYAAEALICYSEDDVFRECVVEAFDIPSFLAVQERMRRMLVADEYMSR